MLKSLNFRLSRARSNTLKINTQAWGPLAASVSTTQVLILGREFEPHVKAQSLL